MNDKLVNLYRLRTSSYTIIRDAKKAKRTSRMLTWNCKGTSVSETYDPGMLPLVKHTDRDTQHFCHPKQRQTLVNAELGLTRHRVQRAELFEDHLQHGGRVGSGH